MKDTVVRIVVVLHVAEAAYMKEVCYIVLEGTNPAFIYIEYKSTGCVLKYTRFTCSKRNWCLSLSAN